MGVFAAQIGGALLALDLRYGGPGALRENQIACSFKRGGQSPKMNPVGSQVHRFPIVVQRGPVVAKSCGRPAGHIVGIYIVRDGPEPLELKLPGVVETLLQQKESPLFNKVAAPR